MRRGDTRRAVVRDQRREMNDALARAYHGPPVDLGAAAYGDLPPCFEGEERAEAHEDLVQLCSGRTLLGVVRHVALMEIEGKDEPCAVVAGAESGSQLMDELLLLSHSGALVASARRRPRAPQGSGRRLEAGAGEGVIDIFLHDGDRAQLHCRVDAAGGGYGSGSVTDAAGNPVGSALLHSTAFVTQLHFFASSGRLRCRAVRAWLPPSSFWLFQPREASHDVGGWCFEFYDRGAPAMHCAAAVLVAAFHTLDRERGRRSGMLGALRGAFAWMRAAVRL